jgi:hypothetical protein
MDNLKPMRNAPVTWQHTQLRQSGEAVQGRVLRVVFWAKVVGIDNGCRWSREDNGVTQSATKYL